MKPASRQKLSNLIRFYANELEVTPQNLELIVAKLAFLNIALKCEADWLVYLKGGSSMQLRVGIQSGRETKDLDLTTRISTADILPRLAALRGKRWDEFVISEVRLEDTPKPTDVPTQYHVLRFAIKIGYGDSEFRTLRVELSAEEFPVEFDEIETSELNAVFSKLGLPPSLSIPTISVELQIAQKLHAVWEIADRRGRDIYDIITLAKDHPIDFELLGNVLKRTYEFRRNRDWSVDASSLRELEESYLLATKGIKDVPDFETALSELTQIINKIAK